VKRLGGILAALMILGVAPSEAARPILDATYKGRTAQDRAIKLKIAKNRREVLRIQAKLRIRCAALGGMTTQGVDVAIKVSRAGNFSSTFVEVSSLEGLFGPVVVAGRRRNVFDVTKSRLSGRFVTRNRVQGSWRERSVVYDRDEYPDSVAPVDRCDTGSVSFSARRR
jgi:hypothetical protein